MLSKLPPDYDPFEVKERLKILGQHNPLTIFLRQEIDRIQRVNLYLTYGIIPITSYAQFNIPF